MSLMQNPDRLMGLIFIVAVSVGAGIIGGIVIGDYVSYSSHVELRPDVLAYAARRPPLPILPRVFQPLPDVWLRASGICLGLDLPQRRKAGGPCEEAIHHASAVCRARVVGRHDDEIACIGLEHLVMQGYVTPCYFAPPGCTSTWPAY